MSDFEAGYRSLGYDDTTDLGPAKQETFEPVLRDIQAARAALHPVAYPDHIRLPEGHPLLASRWDRETSSDRRIWFHNVSIEPSSVPHVVPERGTQM